jgi:outer membrane protein TolC
VLKTNVDLERAQLIQSTLAAPAAGNEQTRGQVVMIMLPSGLRSSLIERRPDIHAAEQTLVATNPETIPDPLRAT